MLEVGKLYSCSKYFLLLYPDRETVAAAAAESAPIVLVRTESLAAPVAFGLLAAYWTRILEKPILYVEKNVPLLVLTVEEKYVEVLAGDHKGWIINEDWLDIGEIVDAAA